MASKRAIRRKACTGKTQHDTIEKAYGHKHSLLALGETNIDVYKCKFCGFWHVGHRDAKSKAVIRSKANGN